MEFNLVEGFDDREDYEDYVDKLIYITNSINITKKTLLTGRNAGGGYPYYCNDIIQWLNQLGLSRDYLPPSPSDEHHALADARWVRDSYYKIESYFNYIKEY